ncbi:hypothetical protein T31B1_12174 [Salinisphaera sp. T31B1]
MSQIGLLGLGLCLLAGCVHETPRQTPSRQSGVAAQIIAPSDPAVALLNFAHELHAATPQQRADAVVAARKAAQDTPGAYSYANLALAYGTPGQRRYTPDEAARYAQRALEADDARWSPAARQYLTDYARLYTQLTKPDTSSDTAPREARDDVPGMDPSPEPSAGDTASLEAQQAHIARLQAELDEAHRKLRELANLEERLGDVRP